MAARVGGLVGRSAELRRIDAALCAATEGRGSALFLLGEAGIGKTRLAAAATSLAVEAGMVALRGRSSTVGPMVPYRPLAEALMALTRAGLLPAPDRLGSYAPSLGQLIPEYGNGSARSPVMMAEALLRLLATVGEQRGCLLVLDDLHDADAETLAIVEYLVDNLAGQPVVLLLASRSEPCPAVDLATTARHRDDAVLLEPRRLDRAEVAELAASRLETRTDQLPGEAIDQLVRDSAGNPFFVEELLYEFARSGRLTPDSEGWQFAGSDRSTVPDTVARSISRRTDRLGPEGQAMLTIAAVIGQRFPLPLLRAATGVDDRTLIATLHAGVAAQLVGPDQPAPDWYVFRHPLTADALLAGLAPTELAAVSRTAVVAIEREYPDLPGEWCARAAELWQQAGEPGRAGELFAEAGQRALADGAVSSAATLLLRADDQLAGHAGPDARADVLDPLLHAIIESGRFEHIAEIAATLDALDRAGLASGRRAVLHANLANVATLAGRPVEARSQLDTARRLLGDHPVDAEAAQVDVIAAYLELGRPGPGRLVRAEELAGRAAAAAQRAGLSAVACDALQLLGYLTRQRDHAAASAYYQQAARIADANQLRVWRVYSDVFLARGDWMADGDPAALERAVDQALAIGALPLGYEAKGLLGLDLVQRAEFDAAEALLTDTLATARRLRLGRAIPFLQVFRATRLAHQGRGPELTEALAELAGSAPNAPYLRPAAAGLRAFAALLDDDLDRAGDELVRAVADDTENPITFDYGRYGLAVLLDVLAGRIGWPGYRAATEFDASRARWNAQFAQLAHAVLLGRDGRPEEADAAARAARRAAEIYPVARHLGWRLVAAEAYEAGWGEPVEWLRQAEQYFHDHSFPAAASACRSLLRGMGVTVRQRRTGSDRIPGELRRLGVTAREYEVAELLAERIGNKAIGGRLHISPRTVEKHVASLLAKTGQPDRESFAGYARGLLD